MWFSLYASLTAQGNPYSSAIFKRTPGTEVAIICHRKIPVAKEYKILSTTYKFKGRLTFWKEQDWFPLFSSPAPSLLTCGTVAQLSSSLASQARYLVKHHWWGCTSKHSRAQGTEEVCNGHFDHFMHLGASSFMTCKTQLRKQNKRVRQSNAMG